MKVEELRILLNAESTEHVRKALNYISGNSNANHISILIECLRMTHDPEIRYEIEAMLGAMHIDGAEAQLISCMADRANHSVGVKLLEFIWSNGFAGEGNLEFLVDYASKFGLLGWIEFNSIIELGGGKYAQHEVLKAIQFLSALKKNVSDT
jgi:hypothetical protein